MSEKHCSFKKRMLKKININDGDVLIFKGSNYGATELESMVAGFKSLYKNKRFCIVSLAPGDDLYKLPEEDAKKLKKHLEQY